MTKLSKNLQALNLEASARAIDQASLIRTMQDRIDGRKEPAAATRPAAPDDAFGRSASPSAAASSGAPRFAADWPVARGNTLAVRCDPSRVLESTSDRAEKAAAIIADMRARGLEGAHLEFTDLLGDRYAYWYDIDEVESAMVSGITFDGSSIPGFSTIEQSDLKLLPDLDTYRPLPMSLDDNKAARIICDPCESGGDPFAAAPRNLLKKLVNELPFDFNVAPEIEFFMVDRRPESRDTNGTNGGYAKHGIQDVTHKAKVEMLKVMREMGMRPEKTHGEVASVPGKHAGQHEITMKYGPALDTADRLVTAKLIIEKIADKYGFDVNFMPKPFKDVNGSGGHINYSLFDPATKKNMFYSPDGVAKLSKTAQEFLAGNLRHMSALTAIMNPTHNSYERLVKGFEAPVFKTWGPMNRSVEFRIPRINQGEEKSQRIEHRASDLMTNPYAAYALLLATGLQGIKDHEVLAPPQTDDLFELTPEEVEARGIDSLPASLPEALRELQVDDKVGELMGEGMRSAFIKLERNRKD